MKDQIRTLLIKIYTAFVNSKCIQTYKHRILLQYDNTIR